jgi:hypothetical protein
MSFPFTHEEYTDIYFVYRFDNGNGTGALTEYWQHFPNHRVPHQNMFYSVHRNLRETSHKQMQNVSSSSSSMTGKANVLSGVQ